MADERTPRAFGPAAVYLALAVAWSWPLPLHLATRFTHDPGDPLLVTYLLWWNAQAVPLTQAWWNAPYYWPMHDALALTEHLAGLSPFTTPIQLAGGSPLLAYNLVLIASTWWAGLATHALVRRLTGRTAAAYVAGVAFAFAPYRTSMLAHLQLYACWWMPVVFLALHAWYEQRRARWLLAAAVAWALLGLTTGYFLLFVPVLIAFWLAWFTRQAQVRLAVQAVGAFTIAGVAVLPFLLHYRAVQAAHGLSRNHGEMVTYSAYAGAFLSADPILRFWHTVEPRTTEQYLFPGMTAFALLVIGLFVAGRDRRFQFYATAAVLMAVLATGPAAVAGSWAALWHPYSWLTWLPGYSGLRVPARFYMVAIFCLAVSAGLAFSEIQRRLRRPGALAGIACLVFAGLAVDGAIAGMPLGAPPARLPLREAGARVLSLPFEEGRVSVFAMYQSMLHRMPVVNGYTGYVPSHADVIEWGLRRRDPTILTELRRGHPLYVLVASTDQADTWTAFMSRQPEAEMLGVQGGGRLYRLSPAPYAREVRPGIRLVPRSTTVDADWITVDAGERRALRSIEVRTHGNLVRLPANLRIETSLDRLAWVTRFDDRPGGAALAGALRLPRVIPIVLDLSDVEARYVRVNTPAFGSAAITVYVP